MENQATLNNINKVISSKKIEKAQKIGNDLAQKLNKKTETPLSTTIPKVSYLRKYGIKALSAGLFVCVVLKPSIIERIFSIFDFKQRKKDRTETRHLKFPQDVI